MLETLGKIGRFLKMVNIKTIYFNFKYFSTRVAIKLPVLISSDVILKRCQGKVLLEGPILTGMVRIGYNDVAIFDRRRSKSILEISGEMIFRGKALLGHGSRISIAGSGRLIFGKDFEITAESAIICYEEIEFGSDCLLSWDILFLRTRAIMMRAGNRLCITFFCSFRCYLLLWTMQRVNTSRNLSIRCICRLYSFMHIC